MGRNRIIFYCIFGAYQLMAFVFTIAIDTSASVLFKMASYVFLFKYLSLIGVLLVGIDLIWAWRLSRKSEDEAAEFKTENNTLKARIYDFQETKKETAGSK